MQRDKRRAKSLKNNVSSVCNNAYRKRHEKFFLHDKRRVQDDKRRVKSLKNQAWRPYAFQHPDDKRRVMSRFFKGLER
jgi:hypothetical protein